MNFDIYSIGEFFVSYADDFWAQGEKAYHFVEVLFAWVLTLGACVVAFLVISSLGCVIADWIKEKFGHG